MVTNTDLAVVQRGELWTTDAACRQPIQPDAFEHELSQGDELAIAIEAATPIAGDVVRYLRDQQVPVQRLVVFSPPGGPRDNAVEGPAGACALAYGLRQAARQATGTHPRVHLFLAGPMGLALILGHRWNRLAPTTVYEDIAALSYEAAFTVSA
jgi:SMODS-associated and fused to various effectors sensor domain